jgi:hypothetical protein
MRKVFLVLASVLSVAALVFSGCKGSVTETVVSTQTVTSTNTLTQTSVAISTLPAVTLPVVTETVTSTLPQDTVTVTGPETTVTSTSTKTQTTIITASPTMTTNTFEGTVVFSYSGKGNLSTTFFSIYESPWVFQYTTDWDGDFNAFLVQDTSSPNPCVVSATVTAWETYHTYVYNKTGMNMYFKIEDAPHDGLWTIKVIQLA